MSPDSPESIDAVDVLLKVGTFVCFVVFGICMWFIRRSRDKQKSTGDQSAKPPKISNG
jgi:hypothetical protein